MSSNNYGDSLVLWSGAAAMTTTTTTKWFSVAECGALRRAKELFFSLEVTAAATDAGDILEVKVQDGWEGTSSIIPNDRLRFADVLGNGGAKIYVASFPPPPTTVIGPAVPSVTMAAASSATGPWPSLIRMVATITDAGTDNASFTFTLKAYIKG